MTPHSYPVVTAPGLRVVGTDDESSGSRGSSFSFGRCALAVFFGSARLMPCWLYCIVLISLCFQRSIYLYIYIHDYIHTIYIRINNIYHHISTDVHLLDIWDFPFPLIPFLATRTLDPASDIAGAASYPLSPTRCGPRIGGLPKAFPRCLEPFSLGPEGKWLWLWLNSYIK